MDRFLIKNVEKADGQTHSAVSSREAVNDSGEEMRRQTQVSRVKQRKVGENKYTASTGHLREMNRHILISSTPHEPSVLNM